MPKIALFTNWPGFMHNGAMADEGTGSESNSVFRDI